MRNAIIGVVVLLTSSVASAGYKQDSFVTVGATYFYGQLGSARSSANTKEYIGCEIDAVAGRLHADYTCTAVDATGTLYKTCSGFDPVIAQAIMAITPQSSIFVSIDSSGGCDVVDIGTYSYQRPPVP